MNTYYFEVTDTFGTDANYSWVNHHKVNAKSLHGALIKLAKYTGLNFRFDGFRYNAINACICAFLIDDEYSIENYNFKEV